MRDEITLTEYDDASIATAYRTLAGRLRAQAADIEGVIALWAGVPYGHPGASSAEAELLREAAAVVDDLLAKLAPKRAAIYRAGKVADNYRSKLAAMASNEVKALLTGEFARDDDARSAKTCQN